MHAMCMLASKGVVCKFKVLVVQFEKKSAGSSNRCSFGVRGYLNSSPQVLCTICIDIWSMHSSDDNNIYDHTTHSQ